MWIEKFVRPSPSHAHFDSHGWPCDMRLSVCACIQASLCTYVNVHVPSIARNINQYIYIYGTPPKKNYLQTCLYTCVIPHINTHAHTHTHTHVTWIIPHDPKGTIVCTL